MRALTLKFLCVVLRSNRNGPFYLQALGLWGEYTVSMRIPSYHLSSSEARQQTGLSTIQVQRLWGTDDLVCCPPYDTRGTGSDGARIVSAGKLRASPSERSAELTSKPRARQDSRLIHLPGTGCGGRQIRRLKILLAAATRAPTRRPANFVHPVPIRANNYS